MVPRRGRHRIEDDEIVQLLYLDCLAVRAAHEDLGWDAVTALVGVPFGTWKRWRRRFLALEKTIPKNDPETRDGGRSLEESKTPSAQNSPAGRRTA